MTKLGFVICMIEMVLLVGISACIFWLVERFYGIERLERKIKELLGIYE